MEQRLGRDAPAVHADAAGIHLGIDKGHAEAEVGGQEGGGVSAGPAAHDNHLR